LNPQVRPEQGEAFAVEVTAVRLLAGREHSRRELCRKLSGRYSDTDLIASVLDDLQRRDLVSDERFAANYIDQRIRKGYGPLRIRAELAERGVSGELASVCLDEGEYDWAELLAAAAVRKFGESPVSDRRELARRGRFLEQRGFPLGLVGRYLDRVRDF